ncbi:MAG: metallophosphoesterase [Gemmataceae bacterium]
MNRRQFLTSSATATAALAVGGIGYGFFEAGWVTIDRRTLTIPGLPAPFRGTTVAFLTDLHHGPYVDLQYIANVVRTTNLLQPDLVILGGDYSLRNRSFVRPCLEVLADLRAPMGILGVLGNHDYWHGLTDTLEGFRAARIECLTNCSTSFTRRGETLHIAGVDDLWAGDVNMGQALAAVPDTAKCLLVSHNPDVAEKLRDPRVGLMLSGHTHGGQILFPNGDCPWIPSQYGTKYQQGLVQAPETQVFISRGLGVSSVPARCLARPEINLITRG